VSELRLMAVHAHPDDESSKGAATLARYADEGHRALVVTLTGGERGEILNPRWTCPTCMDTSPEIRRDEMAKAAEILGVEHTWLASSTPAYPRAIRRHRYPTAALRWCPFRRPPKRWVLRGPRVPAARDDHLRTRTAATRIPNHIRCHEGLSRGLRGGQRLLPFSGRR